MRRYSLVWVLPVSLWLVACGGSSPAFTSPDGADGADGGSVDVPSPVVEEDAADGPSQSDVIVPAESPLGNCTLGAAAEGIYPNTWCEQRLGVRAVCTTEGCVEAEPSGLPDGPAGPPRHTPAWPGGLP